MREIHYCYWASQPNIYLKCGGQTTPDWNQPEDLPEEVYRDEDGGFYTFNIEKVTCSSCKEEQKDE